jgi:type IV secretion system protein VirB7
MKLALILAAALAGCTRAGPFITHVENAGGGRIAVESCYVEYTMFVNTIHTGECTHYVVHVNAQPPMAPPPFERP